MRKILPIILFVFLLSAPAAARQTLVIGIMCLDSDDCQMPVAEAFLDEIYSRSGLDVEVRYLPHLREIHDANTLVIDGTLSRTPIATRDYPNLIKVPYPLFKETIEAASLKPGIHIDSWEDLQQYKVGILRGNRTPYLLAEAHAVDIHLFNTWNSGLAMLQEGRIDVILGMRNIINGAAQRAGVDNVSFSPPLARTYSYHCLHKSHKDLAPRIARSIEEMLKDGTSRRILGKWAVLLPELPLRDQSGTSDD